MAMVVVVAQSSLGEAQAEDSDSNKQQFLTSCGVCHTAEHGAPNRLGPNLYGVFGRKAGTVNGFK
jgi:cytochrome c